MTLTQDQTSRISDVVSRMSTSWVTIENPVISSRGMFGLFPRVSGPLEDAFAKVGATIQVNYTAPAKRGAAANLRVLSGLVGHNLYFVARCTPAAIEGAFNIELDLSPQRTDGESDDDALLSDGMLSVCEDLLGEGLLTAEGLGAFLRRQLHRATHSKPHLLAALAQVLADELQGETSEGSGLY